jgi:DNA-binding SARP family transcriptional activator/tetratricopeptide (TPR) repeat protein
MADAEFKLLGPVEVCGEDGPVALGGPRGQGVLAALLLDVNRIVSIDQIVAAAWGDHPPSGARVQAQNRVSVLRRVLPRAADGPSAITTRGSGYVLRVPDDQIDALRFAGLVATADDMIAAARQKDAAVALDDALRIWRGPALDGLSTPPLAAAARRLEEERLQALEKRIELHLAAGRHSELLPELFGLTQAHPYRERLREYLMLALYGTGRQAEALEVFRETRSLLVNQLAVEPGVEIRRLHEAVLRANDRNGANGLRIEDWLGHVSRLGSGRASNHAATAGPVPRQLPPDLPEFCGRLDAVASLNALLAAAQGRAGPTAPPVAAITGTPGVGKTALAIHWAHTVTDQFPDGQLYVNLGGFDSDGAALMPAEALRGFLDTLGVATERIPADPPARVGLYRSLLADKRVLVVLDNARDEEQVRPLLPGTPGCLTLVTSRNRLSGLVAAEGARPLHLDLLTATEARTMLAHRVGPDRVAADPVAVDEIIHRCARLPLALAIVAARAATHPSFPVAALADQLRETAHALDGFVGNDPATDVRDVFSWSYRALSADAAQLFRMFGLHPVSHEISAAAAASLMATDVQGVRPALAELVTANLVSEPAPGRYALHDLLRAYATELARSVDPAPARRSALQRVLDHYLHTAHRAALLVHPHRDPIIPAPSERHGDAKVALDNREMALAWFTAERQTLVEAILHACAAGFDGHAWRLAWTLVDFLNWHGRWSDIVRTQRAALDAARRLCDLPGQAYAHLFLAGAAVRQGRFSESVDHYTRAISLFGEVDDPVGQAKSHLALAASHALRDRYEEALVHAHRALDQYQAAHHRSGRADALNAIGWYHAHLGRAEQAMSYCKQALSLLRELDNRHGQADTLDSLGYIHRQLRDYAGAAECYRHAVDLYRALGVRRAAAESLVNLGETHEAARDPLAARDAWRAALTIYEELGLPRAGDVRAKLAAARVERAAETPARTPASGPTG